jgi:WD40 repeat protein
LIDRFIDQLGDPDPSRRQDAAKGLASFGERAIAPLRAAAKGHAVPAVRNHAAMVLAAIERDLHLVIGNGATGYWLNRVALTPDGKRVVATGGAVILYDPEAGKEIRRYLELNFARCGFALSRDGKQFVTGHQYDRVVRLGELETGKVLRNFEGHTAGVWAVALSPDGHRIASGGDDRTLRLWDADNVKELKQFPGIADGIRALDFSADGKRLASGHNGPESTFLVRLWDVEGGKEIRSFNGHTKDVSAVRFTPDGKTLLSTGMDGEVILWDVEGGKEIRKMSHGGGVRDAALSPDGKRALTGGFGDKTVRLWELATGKELRAFEGHAGAVLGVAFSGDGRRAVSSDARCTVRFWKLPQ